MFQKGTQSSLFTTERNSPEQEHAAAGAARPGFPVRETKSLIWAMSHQTGQNREMTSGALWKPPGHSAGKPTLDHRCPRFQTLRTRPATALHREQPSGTAHVREVPLTRKQRPEPSSGNKAVCRRQMRAWEGGTKKGLSLHVAAG